MRPKFVAALLSTATLILCAAFYLKEHFAGGEAPGTGNASPPANTQVALLKPKILNPAAIFVPVVEPIISVATVVTPEQRRTAIDAKVDRLQQLSATANVDSLPEILDCLTNSEREIRTAAVEAAREYGSTNAISALKTAAENIGDIQEKIAFLEAADFLLLPPLTFENQPVARTAERIQADQQRHTQRHPVPNPPPAFGN
jgi:hypothetical protein